MNRIKVKSFFLFLFGILYASSFLFSQEDEQKNIQILHSDEVIYDEQLYGKDVQLLKGNVLLEHKGTYIQCNYAFYNGIENSFFAHDSIFVFRGDSLQMCSSLLQFDGNTEVLKATEDVTLYQDKADLYSDTVYYFQIEERATYPYLGKVVDSQTVLTSVKANYFTNKNYVDFFENVVITNPQCTIYSEVITYDLDKEIVYSKARSKAVAENSITWSDLSQFYSKEKLFSSNGNIEHYHDNFIIYSDSAYGFLDTEEYRLYHNIRMNDTIKKANIFGDTLYLFKPIDSFIIFGTPMVQKYFKTDTLSLHGDTIIGHTVDSLKYLDIFPKVKFYKPNMSGKGDKIKINQKTQLFKLYDDNPVTWMEGFQITGDTISMLFNKKTNNFDSLFVINNVFIVSKDLDSLNNFTDNYNQIKGRNLKGKIDTVKNKIDNIYISGNGEIFYFVRNESKVLTGIYKVQSSDIYIKFDSTTIEKYKVIQSPEGNMSPEYKIPKNTRKLQGFIWREEEKPIKKEDIFIYELKRPVDTVPPPFPTELRKY